MTSPPTIHNDAFSYGLSLKSFLDILEDRLMDRPEKVRKLMLAEGEALFNSRGLDYRDYILPKYIQTVSSPLYNYMDATNAELSVVFLVRDIEDLRRKFRDRSDSDELADYIDIAIGSIYRDKRRGVFNLDILCSVRDTLKLAAEAVYKNSHEETTLALIRELEALSMLHREEYGKVESSMLTSLGNPSLSGNIDGITASASGQRLGGGNRLNVTSTVLGIACSLLHTHDADITNTVFGMNNIFISLNNSAVRKLVSDQMILNDKKFVLFLLNKSQNGNLDIDPDCINKLLIAVKKVDVDVNMLNAFYRHFSSKLDLANEENSRSVENRLAVVKKFRDIVIKPKHSVKWLMSRSRSSDIELYDKRLEELTAELTKLLPSGLDVDVRTRSHMIPIAMRIVINSAIAKSIIEVSTKHAFEDNITKEEVMKNVEEALLSDIIHNIRSLKSLSILHRVELCKIYIGTYSALLSKNRRDSNLIVLAEKIENDMSCEKLYATLMEIVSEADTVEFCYFMRQLLHCSTYDMEIILANRDTISLKVLNIGKYISSIVNERLILNRTVNLRKRRIVNNVNNFVQIRKELEFERIGRGYVTMLDNQIKMVLAQFTVMLGKNLHIEYKKGWKQKYVRLRSDLLRVLRDRISHIEDDHLIEIDIHRIIRHHIFSSYHRYFGIDPSDTGITQSKLFNTLLDYYHLLRALNVFLPSVVQARISRYIIDNEGGLFEKLNDENIELSEKVSMYREFLKGYGTITDSPQENQLDDCPNCIINMLLNQVCGRVLTFRKSKSLVDKFISNRPEYKYRNVSGTDGTSKSRERKGIVNRGLVRIHNW